MTSREVILRHGSVDQTMIRPGWPWWAFGIHLIRSKMSTLPQGQVRNGPGQTGRVIIYRFEAGGDWVIDQVGRAAVGTEPDVRPHFSFNQPPFSRMVVPGRAGWFHMLVTKVSPRAISSLAQGQTLARARPSPSRTTIARVEEGSHSNHSTRAVAP